MSERQQNLEQNRLNLLKSINIVTNNNKQLFLIQHVFIAYLREIQMINIVLFLFQTLITSNCINLKLLLPTSIC